MAAKNYVQRMLPCTMTSVVDLFLKDVGGYLSLDKVVGCSPGVLGYGTLVFHFHFHKMESTEPIRKYLIWWFENKLNGKLGPYSNAEADGQIWWVKPGVEIKEDRAGML